MKMLSSILKFPKHLLLIVALAFGQASHTKANTEESALTLVKTGIQMLYCGLVVYNSYLAIKSIQQKLLKIEQNKSTQKSPVKQDTQESAMQNQQESVQSSSSAYQPTLTFSDVIGADEAKESLQDIVQFLKDPTAYSNVGARLPKGVLLEGAPGNGKTLLAKALAGETGASFISVTGSDFSDKYVGEGSRKVETLFAKAREYAPCIIFIDEIDGLGKRSDTADGLSSIEQNRIINAFLTQLDGMITDPSKPVIIVAATNHRQNIDPALLRSGRFDTIVRVENPNTVDRIAILQLHAQKIKYDLSIDFGFFAKKTAGFSGADLENLVNKAAIFAARRKASYVEEADFMAALEQIHRGKKYHCAGE